MRPNKKVLQNTITITDYNQITSIKIKKNVKLKQNKVKYNTVRNNNRNTLLM